MEENLAELIPSLIAAVELIMNPNADAAERQEAHQVCESFKESSPHCIRCGMMLAGKEYSPIIRHFGLQLIEHCVRFKWTSLSQPEKEFLKKSTLDLLRSGTGNLVEEQVHIKDGVSRVMVEAIKHEWPQLWQSLLPDLYNICLEGETQTELVLKVFLRLAEDAIIFQNVPSQRRREILQALTQNMGDIFQLFVSLLQSHTTAAETLLKSGQESDVAKAQSHLLVSKSVLTTLTGYLDWVSMQHVLIQNSLLLQMLCLLLSNSSLQLHAAECLLLLVSRKGKPEDRKPLLILFSEDAMKTILNAAVEAEKASRDEYYYLFLKRLCQVLAELGKQLAALWTTASDVERPPNFTMFLDAVMAFTQHPSQMLSSLTMSLWSTFLRHETIAKDPVFLSFMPKLLQSATKTLLKYGFPSQNNSVSCDYARMEFDSDEEYNLFFSKYRADVAETVRLTTLLNPKVAFTIGVDWLKAVLTKPLDIGAGAENGICNLSSPSFVEWDALTVLLESVMSRILVSTEPQPDVQEGVDLLKAVLEYQTQDPLILSCLLSCISALFTFLKYTPETLPAVLEKIFLAVVFNLPGQTKGTRSKAVKNVRQHACSGLVKICKQYQELIFPVFDKLYNHVQVISQDPEQLSQMEKSILTEALILISNQFHNFEKQTSFIEEVLRPVKEIWLSEEFKCAFMSADKFMSYVGLDQPPVEPSSADTCGINRSHISYCIHTILPVMKRTKWPEEEEVCQRGGFIIGKLESGSSVFRNPATAHISVLLPNVFALIRTMHALWLPQSLKLRHADFAKAYDLLENEKLAILGILPPCVDNTSSTGSKHPLERMQNFLSTIHDLSCHILGNAGQCLGYEFYVLPNLASSIVGSVMTNLDTLPDYRLRPIIRVLMKPFIQNCPKDCYKTSVIPLLSELCPYMYQRLSAKWQEINVKCQTSTETEDENPESQEIVEEQVCRQLTRDYLELLGTICYSKRKDVQEDQMAMEEDQSIPTQAKDTSLGDLGSLCISDEAVYPSIVMCAFTGLTWRDNIACVRCTLLCWPLLKKLLQEGKLTSGAVSHFYSTILMALQIHGQHETSQHLLLSLCLQAYELLRPQFKELKDIMLQIPSCQSPALVNFDNMLFNSNPQSKVGEKKKKDSFRRLVADIIGKSVGQQFKREVSYEELPPVFRIRAKRRPVVEEAEDTGLSELFKPSNGDSCS